MPGDNASASPSLVAPGEHRGIVKIFPKPKSSPPTTIYAKIVGHLLVIVVGPPFAIEMILFR